MIKVSPYRAILYKRCTSFEVHIQEQERQVLIISVDSVPLARATYTDEEEIIDTIIASILHIYLNDDCTGSQSLYDDFQNEFLLDYKTNDIVIMYSDNIIKFLVKHDYRKGIRENLLDYFLTPADITNDFKDFSSKLQSFNKSHNIVKEVCKKLGLTYKQLGEKIGVKESTLNKIGSTGEISDQIYTAIELYLKTISLEKELNEYKEFKNFIRKIAQ